MPEGLWLAVVTGESGLVPARGHDWCRLDHQDEACAGLASQASSTGWHGGEPRDGRLAGDNGLEGAKRG